MKMAILTFGSIYLLEGSGFDGRSGGGSVGGSAGGSVGCSAGGSVCGSDGGSEIMGVSVSAPGISSRLMY